jgi:hypothetical protein
MPSITHLKLPPRDTSKTERMPDLPQHSHGGVGVPTVG